MPSRPLIAISAGLLLMVRSGVAQTLEERLLAEPPAAVAADARRLGDAARGAVVFHSRTIACTTCHSIGERAGAIGPDLTKLDQRTSDEAIVESILLPSKVIAPAYAPITVETHDGRIIGGLPVAEDAERLVLRSASDVTALITVRKQEIADRAAATVSIMPSGQINQLADRGQFLDLVRYLVELRDGGAQRARELQPPPSEAAKQVPDTPLAWRPAVQRGDLTLANRRSFANAVALGFVDGSLLFDAHTLTIAALWTDGFVTSRQQPYFGLWWDQAGTLVDTAAITGQPLAFQFDTTSGWQSGEPAKTSDPNTGTRFDGYQVGGAAVRLRYRLLVGGRRIGVHEHVRVERRPGWLGFVRDFRFTDLPPGARVAVALPAEAKELPAPADGTSRAADASPATFIEFSSGKARWVVRAPQATLGDADKEHSRLVSPAATAAGTLSFRIDHWNERGPNGQPSAGELAMLRESTPLLDDGFDQPIRPARPAPELPVANQPVQPASPPRPPVDPKENVDEFPVVTGRLLRFTVERTSDKTAPGIDELEVWGPDANHSLSPSGTATASSVIDGFPIHQIPHLNDGKVGNDFSWISGQDGAGWAQIEFPAPVKMNKVVWSRDRTGKQKDRLAVAYRIEVSADGTRWTKVGDATGRGAQPTAAAKPLRRDAAPGYVMESIPLPFPECRPSGVAFSDDGMLYAITMTEGQVWRTRIPPPGQPERVAWQRFASGLYHPIGLQIVDGRIYVAQKPEISELIDRDGDGCADHCRTVATGWGLSDNGWHEYCFGLAVDAERNLWFTLNTGNFWTHPGLVKPGRWRGSILRVGHGSEKLDVVATGCRTPNGIARGPGGTVFFTDNQGDWIPTCKLAPIVPGRFYGHPEAAADALPKEAFPDGKSAVWLPFDRSKSTSGPTWDGTQGRFGPFADQMFVGDAGYGANPGIMRIALEKVNGEYQGACFRFVDGQPLGCERMAFGPDHHLYVVALSTGLARIRYADQTPAAIHALHVRPGGVGFTVDLTKPLAADAAPQAEQCKVRSYHYEYSGKYGSPETGTRQIAVERVDVSSDRRQLTLTFPVEKHPLGMVYAFDFKGLTFVEGERLVQTEAWYTVQQIPER